MYKVDLGTLSDISKQRAIMQRLNEAAENAKIDLSSLLETNVNLPFIYTGGEEPRIKTPSRAGARGPGRT
jgi:molecular chaperone DnaK